MTFIRLFKSVSVKKKEFLFDDSNVLCKAEHMAVQNSSDGLSFLIRNYFHTQLY